MKNYFKQAKHRKVFVQDTFLGKGVICKEKIRKREIIGRVHGKIVEEPDSENEYYLDFGENSILEPSSPFRYLNHSCDPNVALDLRGTGKTRALYVRALRPIRPGEELRNDYEWDAAESSIPCKCGVPACRGWIVSKSQVPKLKKILGENKFFKKQHFPKTYNFPSNFRDILNSEGQRLLKNSAASYSSSLKNSKKLHRIVANIFDTAQHKSIIKCLDKNMYSFLRPWAHPIPRSSITGMEESYTDMLPKTVNLKTMDLNSNNTKGYKKALDIGLIPMLKSKSTHSLAEIISGYKLELDFDLQIHCYEKGHFSGPHHDHFPEIISATRGYIDFHLSFCNENVDHQWLVWEEKGFFSNMIPIHHPASASTLKLPFWHYTTPLMAKKERKKQARRWLLVCSFDIRR